jgi:ABC-type Na+ transport system ATPase subunit NatA
MNIRPADRAKVKLQILRLLATLRLEPEKMDLIAGFMETYLALTAREELAFEEELDKLESREQKASVMELMTSWERKGRAEGPTS